MELKEAIDELELMIFYASNFKITKDEEANFKIIKAIKTVLNYIENESIPKEKVREKMNSYDDIICYAGTEEGMAELKQEEYDEAFYGNKALQELLEE